ncbi:hypothetical protein T3A99_14110 [Pseudomonas sp. N-137]|uniref:hypothetical protein n=1 Tax=unclassified Pseudomonas TaxID=196821 RepID=UPI00236364D4|nr:MULTISPECIES: hypothetical protein [unclassified Pseudomonas]MDD2034455.1 hypothetical protein [Pseudomonas sp. 39167]MEA1029697.1 hypothetical protein [Pseudomonas sp. N-137]
MTLRAAKASIEISGKVIAMAFLEENQMQGENSEVMAKPLSVEGINDNDLEGHVPREILQRGTRIVIPYWIDPRPNDELWIIWLQNGLEDRLYTVFYPVPLAVDFLYFDLTSQHLAKDGVAYVYYNIWKGAGGTDDPSPRRQLTIDHTPLIILAEPTFPHANLWGYLNNNSVPPLTSGATVAIPSLTNIALPGDQVKVQWQGYSSLNGSGPPVSGTYGVWERILQAPDISAGFDLVVPFQPNIRPLIDKDSAVVVYQLFHGGRLVAESRKGLVKIDRVTPGESTPSTMSNMNVIGEATMAIKIVPPKTRPMSTRSGVLDLDVDIDTLADESISIAVLETGEIIANLERPVPTEEGEDDEVDLYYARVGETFGDAKHTVLVGPIDQRPAGVLPIPLPAADFIEDAQPATPTRWQVQMKFHKDGGGNFDPTNIVEFNIDRTAPFEVKYPSRKKNPPTPAPAFTNAPTDPLRTVNEAWLTANTDLEFTVDVTYPLRRLDDELEVHFSAGGMDLQVYKAAVPATGVFTVLSSVLRGLPNGRVNIHYFWTDLPGNRSASSLPSALLTLGLALDPVLNKRPLVPATDPDGATTLYLDDFSGSGVLGIVERLPIDNAEPGDQIKFYVEEANDPTNFKAFGPQPLADVDLNFPLPYVAGLKDIFGASTDALEVKAYFELERGAATPFPSPPLFFWMDLYPPGGIYPELPDLTNPAFALPVVTGQSLTPNELLPGDRDKAGKFKVTLALTDPPITSAETVKCYVNDQLVGDFSPFSDAIEFEVPITASIIAALPTPSVPAHWTRQRTGIDKNVIKSTAQTVIVRGKRIDLLEPTIRIRNPATKNQIDCFAMNDATTNWRLALTIPKSTVLPQGTVITAHFAAYTDAAGANLIPGTEDSQTYTIQDASTVDVATVGSAAVFKAAQPVLGSRAFGKYWYTADIGGLQSSIPVIKPLDTITPSGEYCDRLPVPTP